MRTFKPLQPKRLLTSAPTTLTSRLLQSSRSLLPVSAPVPELAPPVTQAQLERAAHFEHCFAHVPVFPPSVSVQRQEADGKPMQKRSASEWMEEDAARDEEVTPTALTSRLLQSPRPPTSVSAPEAAFPVTQAKRERVPHLGHSFAQLFEASAHRSAVSPSTSLLPSLPQNEVPLQRTAEPRPNTTGLPDTLKAGVEDLSGLSLDDVHVHYHSSKPAEIQALAYTQGTDIHVGPGQERHLAHEAWHVVQQKQERVRPTMQAKGMPVNDDHGLEREADAMGVKAASSRTLAKPSIPLASPPLQGIIQGTFKIVNQDITTREQVEGKRERIKEGLSKRSEGDLNPVMELLKGWAVLEEDKGRYGSYKQLAQAALGAVRQRQGQSLPNLAPTVISIGGSKNYDSTTLTKEEKIEKLSQLHRAASEESFRKEEVRVHRDTSKLVRLQHVGTGKDFTIGHTGNLLLGGLQESKYKELFEGAKRFSGLTDSQLAQRLIRGLTDEQRYLEGLEPDAQSYIVKILALIQGPEFRRSAINPTAAIAAFNKVAQATDADIYQTLLDNALFTVSDEVASPGGSQRSQFHRISFSHNEHFQQVAANQFDTIMQLADANKVDINDEEAVATFVTQTTNSTVKGFLKEFTQLHRKPFQASICESSQNDSPSTWPW